MINEKNIADALAADNINGVSKYLNDRFGIGMLCGDEDQAQAITELSDIYKTIPADIKSHFLLSMQKTLSKREVSKKDTPDNKLTQDLHGFYNMSREDAIAFCVSLYENGQKKTFAAAFNFFSTQHAPHFAQDVGDAPEINALIHDFGFINSLIHSTMVTPLLMVVSNEELQIESIAELDKVDGEWSVDAEHELMEGFEIIASNGYSASLPRLTVHALSEFHQHRSTEFGTYFFQSSNESFFPNNIVSIHARILQLIDQGSNSHNSAVQRLKAQRQSCAGSYRVGLTGKMYLAEAGGIPDWAAAINGDQARRNPTPENLHQTMKNLVEYGGFNQLLSIHAHADTAEQQDASNTGFIAGVNTLLTHLQTLITEKSESQPHPSFDWYTETRGFHSDLEAMDYNDKRHMAMLDVADMLIASLSFNPLFQGFRMLQAGNAPEDPISRSYTQLAQNYPAKEIFKSLVGIRYIDGLNRFFKVVSKRKVPTTEEMQDIAKRAHIFMTETYKLNFPANTPGLEELGLPKQFNARACASGEKLYLSAPGIVGHGELVSIEDIEFIGCKGTEAQDLRRVYNDTVIRCVYGTLESLSKKDYLPQTIQPAIDNMKNAFDQAAETPVKNGSDTTITPGRALNRLGDVVRRLQGSESWTSSLG